MQKETLINKSERKLKNSQIVIQRFDISNSDEKMIRRYQYDTQLNEMVCTDILSGKKIDLYQTWAGWQNV